MIMKAISTNNSNYTSPLLKCDKADNVAFIEFIMLTGTSSFHLSSLRYGSSVNVYKLATTLNVFILHLWFRYTTRRVFFCVSMHISDLRRKYVSSMLSVVLL